MPTMASIVGNDPLARFIRDRHGEERRIPLVATRIDVTIRGGLATVVTERTFRNSETSSIEATMTFPVPVDATLCALTARIDGRILTATAQARAQARATYENAVDKGKAAVLHEELLKGIHMLSVAHVRPGGEIAVTDTWTAPLAFTGGTPQLRIPTTVGEIYGRSPLSRSDDLVTGNVVHEASISVICHDGIATLLRAGAAADGRHRITLDSPIDIAVAGWTPQRLEGVSADGRRVTLDIGPAPTSADASLDIDLLLDRSGSMGEAASGNREIGSTKFAVAQTALAAIARDGFGPADRMRLWQFNDSVQFLGEARGAKAQMLVSSLHDPSGGTEIGAALDAVIATGKASNVVIVTDGKSWAFDPQRFARSGIRVTAVLIGEDALEAGISHLAGMTGGQVFIAAGADAGFAIRAALAAARAPVLTPQPIEGQLTHIVALRRGARLIAAWGDRSDRGPTAEARLIGATAAMLAIPLMRSDAAAALAEREGIVCHLTSLVLVDEAGARQEGVPASRKVMLSPPAPASHMASMATCADIGPRMRPLMSPLPQSAVPRSGSGSGIRKLLAAIGDSMRPGSSGSPAPTSAPAPAAPQDSAAVAIDLSGLADQIDWEDDPDALRRGDLSALAPAMATAIERAAAVPAVVTLAMQLGVSAVVVVIALLARSARSSSRSAGRLARAILGPSPTRDVETAMHALAL